MTKKICVEAFCIIIFVMLFIAGCAPSIWYRSHINRSNVAGRYVVEWKPYSGCNLGRETLIVRSNGTFKQIFTAPRKHTYTNTGKWELERNSGGVMIHLIDAKQYVSDSYNGLNAKPQLTDESFGIVRRGTRVLIIIDEDNDLYYIKQK